MITALCGQAGGITKSGKPCRIRVSDSGRLCMAHDPQHRKNGLLAEDGDRNVTQTITDGIIKGIGDGPDPGHHEPAEHNPYTLPPPKTVEGKSEDDDDGIHQLDLNKVITAEFDDAQWLIEPVIPATVQQPSTPPARLVKACSCSTSSQPRHQVATSSAGPHWKHPSTSSTWIKK